MICRVLWPFAFLLFLTMCSCEQQAPNKATVPQKSLSNQKLAEQNPPQEGKVSEGKKKRPNKFSVPVYSGNDLNFWLKLIQEKYNSAIAAVAVAEFGPPAIAPLKKLLLSQLGEVEADVHWALWRLTSDQQEFQALVKLLSHENKDVRRNTYGVLIRMGLEAKPAIPALIQALEKETVLNVKLLAKVLGDLGLEAKAAIPALKKYREQPVLSENPDESAPIFVAWAQIQINVALWNLAKEKTAIDSLITLTKSPFHLVSGDAAGELLSCGVEDDLILPVLLDLLKDYRENSHFNRVNAAHFLGKMGSRAKAAIPALLEGTKDQEPSVRRECMEALARIGAEPKIIVPILLETLNNADSFERAAAAKALGLVGPEAKSAIPNLKQIAGDNNPKVQNWSCFALVKITGDSAALSTLAKNAHFSGLFLNHKEIFKELGPELATPILIKILEHEESSMRVNAATILGELGPKAGICAPALKELLEDEDLYVKKMAREALKKIEGK